MGNNNPSSNYGQIYLKTANPFYFAGETVTGEVYLNLMQPFPGNIVSLKLKGIEMCRWEEMETRWRTNPDGTRTSYQEPIELRGHNSFYRHNFPIFIFNTNVIAPGQYCFPFCFVPGSNLPGSFFEQENGFTAVIKYKVKAELTNFQDSGAKLKYCQPLILREPIKNQMLYNVPIENAINAKTWCCLSQGVSKMKCFFEKNTYCPGEQANMMCEIENSQCNLPVRNVNIRLLMNIRLITNTGREKFITEVVNSFDLPGIGAHETAVENNRKVAGIFLTNRFRNRAIQPSTTGSLVKCEYILSVKTVLDGVTCCTADPEVRIPLTIFAPPLMNFNQVAAPPNWNPQSMPVYNCVFSEQYAYPPKNAVGGIQPQQFRPQQQPQPFDMNNPRVEFVPIINN